jgi:phosphoglycerate dehydrogenase-like enzyme
MARLLILLTFPQQMRDQYRIRLAQRFPELAIDVTDHHSKAPPLIRDADALLTFGPHARDEVFHAAERLRWVQALGTGVDGIVDQPSLRPGIVVTNVRGIHGGPVSEAAIMLMLALSRGVAESVRNQDRHAWVRWPPPRLLEGKTVGIFGVGLIAEALAPKCKALGMTVTGFTSAKRDLPGFDAMHDRGELIARAGTLDHLALLAPYSKETHRLIDARVFAAMKPTSCLINLARGGIVDEEALLVALDRGEIAGAALDVFQEEPLPADHPLWSHKNVLVTPHLGGFFDEYPERALPTIEHNMACFLRGDFDGMINIVRR